jgi:predicted dehydrogenase
VIDALRAGKHVLCEKPLAANAAQADRMADVARQTGRVLAEGMHYRYHPLASRVAEIVHGGRIGTIRRIVADVCIPLIPWRNPRYRYELGGGAMMDLGCYAVDGVRLIAGAEPQVVRAEARLFAKNVDRWMTAELMFQGGASARITCSIWSLEVPRGRVRVEGDAGELTVNGLFTAHPFHSLTLTAGGEKKSERLDGRGSTYLHQLRAFVAASGGGVPVIADAASAAATLRVIDSVYRQAGLSPRGQ